ncbi:MAG: DUF2782 domain-containing protein [Azoarcus sp.]|jgi:cytochrome oxidase Cu insertion factor (SCO1/SenC/PrrC family)|nr:DUF2782 domain-containing protein [Azoarcus sp.]
MRLPLLASLASAALCAGLLAAPLAAQDAPPENAEPLEEEFPEVTIVRRGGDAFTEFRLRGKLYLVKVEPRHSAPYYLIDRDGKGQWVRDENARKLSPPTWVLTSW